MEFTPCSHSLFSLDVPELFYKVSMNAHRSVIVHSFHAIPCLVALKFAMSPTKLFSSKRGEACEQAYEQVRFRRVLFGQFINQSCAFVQVAERLFHLCVTVGDHTGGGSPEVAYYRAQELPNRSKGPKVEDALRTISEKVKQKLIEVSKKSPETLKQNAQHCDRVCPSASGSGILQFDCMVCLLLRCQPGTTGVWTHPDQKGSEG
eukprot:SAG31_NODE_796_length_12032_cov_21.073242_8_plen_205_part_00